MSQSKKLILGLGALALLIVCTLCLYLNFAPKPVEGAKSITIEVINDQGNSTVYSVNTDSQYLRQAMDEAEGLTYSGSESEYGVMVDTVNGVVADFNTNGAYWSFYINDEYCMNGIDTQPIADQDSFKIIYTTN